MPRSPRFWNFRLLLSVSPVFWHKSSQWLWSTIVLLVLCVKQTLAIPIDNGLDGDPEVQCGTEMLLIRLRTRRPFQGRVFVKGMVDSPDCVRDAASESPLSFPTDIEIAIPHGTCSMRRQRMINPHGMQQSLTIVISFHPIFLTKVDKAYNIRCFYMNQDMMFSQQLHVSQMTTEAIGSTSSIKCEYSIRKNNKDGPLVKYTTLGEKLYHVWQCDLDPTDGMLVRNCYINGGSEGRVQALDQDGCPVDQYVMSFLTYEPDMRSAWVETHAFKFADRPSLNFQCEVNICSKQSGAGGNYQRRSNGPGGTDMPPCNGLTPPNCQGGDANYGGNGGDGGGGFSGGGGGGVARPPAPPHQQPRPPNSNFGGQNSGGGGNFAPQGGSNNFGQPPSSGPGQNRYPPNGGGGNNQINNNRYPPNRGQTGGRPPQGNYPPNNQQQGGYSQGNTGSGGNYQPRSQPQINLPRPANTFPSNGIQQYSAGRPSQTNEQARYGPGNSRFVTRSPPQNNAYNRPGGFDNSGNNLKNSGGYYPSRRGIGDVDAGPPAPPPATTVRFDNFNLNNPPVPRPPIAGYYPPYLRRLRHQKRRFRQKLRRLRRTRKSYKPRPNRLPKDNYNLTMFDTVGIPSRPSPPPTPPQSTTDFVDHQTRRLRDSPVLGGGPTMDVVPENDEIIVLFNSNQQEIDRDLDVTNSTSVIAIQTQQCSCHMVITMAVTVAVGAVTLTFFGVFIIYKRHTTVPKILTS